MLNLANQRPGDLWIIGGEHLEVIDPPVEVEEDFQIPCRIVGTDEPVRICLYVEAR